MPDKHLPLRLYALLWLALVGLVFYSSYGLVNWLSALRAPVPEIAYDWERQIPFLAWTILPYWTLNGFYAVAFFLCRSREELHDYIRQLLAAQALAVLCFLLFPLQFSWGKPVTEGLSGWLFSSLAAFDQPYNQAPSLHIILTLIVGRFYWQRLPPRWRVPLLLWFALIALSVLTTWQHHFIDIPTGALAGALILWLFPGQGRSPWHRMHHPTPGHIRWAAGNGVLAGALACLSLPGGGWLWWLWPAVAFSLLAACYAVLGAQALQKQHHGRHSLAASLLLLPYLLVARLNMAYWLRRQPLSAAVTERLHIGSVLAARQHALVLDTCAEYPACGQWLQYHSVPMLDMVAPPAADLRRAADLLQQMLEQHAQAVLVCCALGYGRSAAVLITWLLRHGGCADIDSALAQLRLVRPRVVLPDATRAQIVLAWQQEEGA